MHASQQLAGAAFHENYRSLFSVFPHLEKCAESFAHISLCNERLNKTPYCAHTHEYTHKSILELVYYTGRKSEIPSNSTRYPIADQEYK